MSGLGRPTIYSSELCQQICAKIAEGYSLREICDTEGMPNKSTVLRWLFETDKEEFKDQYARAREIQAELWADELNDIADNSSNDWMERKYADGSSQIVLNSEAVTRSRLRIDTRKWIAAKLLPKKYGEKIEQTHRGDPEAPIVISQAGAKW